MNIIQSSRKNQLTTLTHLQKKKTYLNKEKLNYYNPEMIRIIVSIIALINIVNAGWVGNCWRTWSRCTGATQFLSGYAWQTCSQYCKCKGYNSGNCRLHKSNCFGLDAYQCQCSGWIGTQNKPAWCGF